jgi:hypothetical protein
LQIYDSPAAWRGSELACQPEWQHILTGSQIVEIERALDHVKQRGLALEAITAQDFPLPVFASELCAVQDSLEKGSGSFFLRGWPVELHSLEDNTRIFWGLSRHLGTPISQSAEGEKIFRVWDAGYRAGDAKARGPNTSKGLHFHCDRCDVIGFLCIHQAKQGGENYLVSSVTVHNEILARRPDLLEALYEPWYYKTHNVDLANDDPWCRQPIFANHEGHFVAYILRVLIDRAYELPEVPNMTPRQKEALDFLDQVCAEPDLNYRFLQEPGDMLFINNFVNFHSRTAFLDYEDPEKKRRLLRIWLSVPNSRPLPPAFAGSFGRTGAGEIRGGIHKVG